MGAVATRSSFKALDPEVAFIAASAAVEVDELIHGRGRTIDNVGRLSELLNNAVLKEGQHGAQVKSLMDPVSTDVFYRAVTTAQQSPVMSLNELANKTQELANNLANLGDKKEILEELRDFCVALSKQALATRHTLQQSRIRNPHKK